MTNPSYQHLEWPQLLQQLAARAQTSQGQSQCLQLSCNLNEESIQKQWQDQIPLRNLIRTGYAPPIGDLEELEKTFRGAKLGQILDAEELRSILGLLQMVKQVTRFLGDFKDKCAPLDRFFRLLYPLPKLSHGIEISIGPEGQVLDTASKELEKTRRAKLSLTKKIESDIRALLTGSPWSDYLQDKFFTIRSDRYVVPIRLDGRGRVKGAIVDTSESGQTLFVEPRSIASANDALIELQLSEKLEIIRIFRELSTLVALDLEQLKANYDLLIELDVLTAKSRLAHDLDATHVELTQHPTLDLMAARHPLLQLNGEHPPVANDIGFKSLQQNSLIISGPNAGGKTVVLKTTGLLHLMVRAGLLVPADERSKLYLFDEVHVALGDPQSISANLSTFSGHLTILKPVLATARRGSLVLLDELAVGTEPQTGSAMAQAILEALSEQGAVTLATTHFDGLKALAVDNPKFRNGSMEFSTQTLQPTYHLTLDVPGQSYGLEVAQHLGFPKRVLERARSLRGNTSSELDRLLQLLEQSREQLHQERQAMEQERLTLTQERHHWEKERLELAQQRAKLAQKVEKVYQQKFRDFQKQTEAMMEQYQKALKETSNPQKLSHNKERRDLLHQGEQADQILSELSHSFGVKVELPGSPCQVEDLVEGSRVFIQSLGKEGVVTKVAGGKAPVEVQAGLLKLRPQVTELRLLDKSSAPAPQKPVMKTKGVLKPASQQGVSLAEGAGLGRLDLRGQDLDRALDQMWKFIDQGVMRGEIQLTIVHGHGTDTLKRGIRNALAKDSPYPLDFRAGRADEGGDGVTVVLLGKGA